MPGKRAKNTDFMRSCAPFGLEVDSELLALFIEMAAFQAEGFSGIGDVMLVAAQFGEDGLALEAGDPVGQVALLASRCGRRRR